MEKNYRHVKMNNAGQYSKEYLLGKVSIDAPKIVFGWRAVWSSWLRHPNDARHHANLKIVQC